VAPGKLAKTHVYGYLLATVSAAGSNKTDPIHFEFREVPEQAASAEVIQRFGPDLVHRCFQDNSRD
jgi:hypothetical protein